MTTEPSLHAGNPTRWGREKLHLLRSWIEAAKQPAPPAPPKQPRTTHFEVGRYAELFARTIFPGAPWVVFLGFAANGESLYANTTDGVAVQHFHEMGLYGTTGGPRNRDAPCTDTRAKFAGEVQPNNWTTLHNDPDVRALLAGRDAVMAHNAWRGAAADQTAVGLVDIRRSSRIVASALDEAIRPDCDSSLWRVALGFMGWSAGEPMAISHIKKHTAKLAAVPETKRLGVLFHEVAMSHPTGRRHHNPAYSCTRTWQKIECGRLMAEELGPTCPAWFSIGLDDEAPLKEALARQAYAESPGVAPTKTG